MFPTAYARYNVQSGQLETWWTNYRNAVNLLPPEQCDRGEWRQVPVVDNRAVIFDEIAPALEVPVEAPALEVPVEAPALEVPVEAPVEVPVEAPARKQRK